MTHRRALNTILALFLSLPATASAHSKYRAAPKNTLSTLAVKPLWTRSLKRPEHPKGYRLETASPVVHGDTVYVGTLSGTLFAIDRKNGKLKWKKASGGPIEGSPLLDGERVYIGNNEGKVIACERTTGSVQWEFAINEEIVTAPTLVGDTLYVLTANDRVIRLDKTTGERLGSFSIASMASFVPDISVRGQGKALLVGSLVVIPLTEGGLAAYHSDTQSLVWRQDLHRLDARLHDSDMTPLISSEHVLIARHSAGLYSLNPATGAIVWEKDWGSMSDFLYHDGSLYVSTTDGTVLAIDPATGAARWQQKIDSGLVLTNPVVFKNKLVVGERHAGLYVLDLQTGAAAGKLPVSGGVTAALLASDSVLYLLSNQHRLYAYALEDF